MGLFTWVINGLYVELSCTCVSGWLSVSLGLGVLVILAVNGFTGVGELFGCWVWCTEWFVGLSCNFVCLLVGGFVFLLFWLFCLLLCCIIYFYLGFNSSCVEVVIVYVITIRNLCGVCKVWLFSLDCWITFELVFMFANC